jgi:CheY-like chemotaxis protein
MNTIKRLLLLDDDELGNNLVSLVFKESGLVETFTIFTNGWETLEYLEKLELQGAQFPDLILVDLKMPEMDGFEFIERYSKQYRTVHSDTNLVILTSSIREKDKSQALTTAHVSAYIHKPLTTEKINSLCELVSKKN